MEYKLIPGTCDTIAGLVTHFFLATTDELRIETRAMIPSGRQYILFHLNGLAKYKTDHQTIECEDSAAVIHLHDFCYSAHFSKACRILGVSMKPNGLHGFFDRNCNKRSFFVQDSREFLGSNALQDLHLSLKKQTDTEQQIARVERFLESNLKPPSPDLVVDFLNFLENNHAELSLKEISKHLLTNQRSLELKFSAITGLTPGRYIKLRRFIDFFRDFADKKHPVKDLILKYNYTDYSHLYRDFKRYTGVSLKESDVHPESFYKAYLSAYGHHFN